MKKLFFILPALLAFVLKADAYIDNQYMTTPQYLENTGYSKEMSRLMAVTNQDPYREEHNEKANFINIAKRSYGYLVPGANTDLDFYYHSGNFNNTSWKDF